MNIVLLTPGTGNFYCGNCLRDNALANELRAEGHNVHLIPLYLPHIVDEPTAAATPLFYGGISVYLEQKLALFRHTPRWLDNLLNNSKLLKWAADHAGMTSAHDLGSITLSMLNGEEGKQNKELTFLINYLKQHLPIDIICLSNAMLLGLARRLKSELSCNIVCTLAGEDGFLDALTPAFKDNCWATLTQRAKDADGFIAVSNYYADVMTNRLSLDPTKVHTVYNGINLEGYTPADSPPDPPTLGYLARMAPFKGLETLVDAFIHLRTNNRIPNLKLKIAGSTVPDDKTFIEKLEKKIAAANLTTDATFHPNLDHAEKIEFLRSLSVFSVPATYGESFGLYLLEAWAAGVPVVQPRHAAFTELIESIGGGILCEPDSAEELAHAIELTLHRHEDSRQSALEARNKVLNDFSVAAMARNVLDVFQQTLDTQPATPSTGT